MSNFDGGEQIFENSKNEIFKKSNFQNGDMGQKKEIGKIGNFDPILTDLLLLTSSRAHAYIIMRLFI